MAKKVSNMNELQKALMPAMVKMIDELAERVYETLNHFLQEYYNSYSPVYYRRLYDFLRSATRIEPKVKGNKVVASVFIDTGYMDDYYNAAWSGWSFVLTMSLRKTNIIYILLVKGVSGGYSLKDLIPWNRLNLLHTGYTAMRWRG